MNDEPAFPFMGSDADRYPSEPGMALRDYFAAKAISGLAQFNQDGITEFDPPGCTLFAERAYKLADAMLKARCLNVGNNDDVTTRLIEALKQCSTGQNAHCMASDGDQALLMQRRLNAINDIVFQALKSVGQ